jgi:aspartate carbamoyltransferase catalytic subunit
MSLARKDLLGTQDMTAEEITSVLDTAGSFMGIGERRIKKVPALRGRTVANLFYEPSTRTRVSFELAAKRLSADFLNISPDISSGETLTDVAKSIEAMAADIIVVRHHMAGAPHLLAKQVRCCVINAGDGPHEHPTQALVDLYTIREKKKQLAGLDVAVVGDILHSRTAKSTIWSLLTMGANITLVGPSTLIPTGIESLGVKVSHVMEDGITGADVIVIAGMELTEDDKALLPSMREYARFYCLTRNRLTYAKPNVLVLHPGPLHRGIDIAPEVADGAESVVIEQVTNGVAVRMAVLYLLIGGEREA